MVLGQLTLTADGLIPAIAQQHDTGEVLMLAWMNIESLRETLASGRVVYWSRSRGQLWRKGDTSGQIQKLIDCRIDCDQQLAHFGISTTYYDPLIGAGIAGLIQDNTKVPMSSSIPTNSMVPDRFYRDVRWAFGR